MAFRASDEGDERNVMIFFPYDMTLNMSEKSFGT